MRFTVPPLLALAGRVTAQVEVRPGEGIGVSASRALAMAAKISKPGLIPSCGFLRRPGTGHGLRRRMGTQLT